MNEAKYREVLARYKGLLASFSSRKFNILLVNSTRESALSHCRAMLDEMETFLNEKRMDKLNRWLGFMQGVFWVLGLYTLHELKDHNRP